MLLALVTGGGVGFGLYVADGRGLLPVKLPALPGMPAPQPEASAAAPAASASAAPEETPAADASAAAPADAPDAPPADGGPSACVAGLWPEASFPDPAPLDFLCGEPDALKAASRLKEQIVVGGKGQGPTGAMKEWAVLGFYELATVAILRGRCCPEAAPLTTPESPGKCGQLSESLASLAKAAAVGAPADGRKAPVASFDENVRCIAKLRQTPRFGYEPLLGGEASTFEKIAARLDAGAAPAAPE